MAATKKKNLVKKKKPVTKSKARAVAALKAPYKVRKGIKKPLVVHHRHTFKLVHHSHTNYALMVFMLLLVGIFCSGWTAFAKGESYGVHAIVPAPPLPTAATIDSPDDGKVFTQSTITVSGSCPSNSYVKLYRNHVFAGTDICQSDGTWSVQTQLVAGTNLLEAQDYNVTDQAGPASNDVTVTYEPPVVPPTDGGGTTTTPGTPEAKAEQAAETKKTEAAAANPLVLDTDFTYKGYLVGEEGQWDFTIGGGTKPYAIQVDWGDGETNLKSVATPGAFSLTHTYNQIGGFRNSFPIKVSATDNDGNTTVLQLFTIISSVATGSGSSGLSDLQSGSGANGSGSAGDNGSPSIYHRFIQIAGPTYAVTLVAVASFWLGELHQVGAVGHSLLKLHWRPHRWRF